MKKCALYIFRPGTTSFMIQQGYVDALRYLGWTVYVSDPKTKLGCRKLIERHGIRLIMTSSRYGIRQLPIQIINDEGIAVVVDALPLNPSNKTIDEPYEFAHDDEPDLIKKIQKVIVHTRLETNLWAEYMQGWCDNDIVPMLLPAAGNIIQALPPTCSTLTDVAMVANFSHRQNIMKCLVEPLFKRLDLLGYSYQAFGDQIWKLAGLNYNGPLGVNSTKLAHVYATAKVCPNVHTTRQVTLQACVNERSFMIPLCGGVQVSDNPLISRYLGSHCSVGTSTTDFMNKVIGLIEDQSRHFDKIRAGAEEVATHHTYFNRLVDLFSVLGLQGFAEEAKTKGQRLAVRHCWELDSILDAAERGISYEQNVVGIT